VPLVGSSMACTPPRALSPPLSCNTGTANGALCAAIVTIVEAATCDELASQQYVQSLIEKVGLAGDVRGARIYGDDKRLMRRVGSHTGLWQDPRQISRAMMALGSLPPQPTKEAPFRYVEVGVFTAWTCCVVSAFLSRVAAGDRGFQGFAVDIKTGNIAAPTLQLFKTLNITFVGRSAFNQQLLAQSADESGPRYDACFIDGDHGYRAVRSDYQQLAPHCRSAMFHDIQDTSTMIADSYSGGVPMFWAHARSHVRRNRVLELTMQGSPYWPVFGIGIVLPGPRGTAEPDDGVTIASWPTSQGGIVNETSIESILAATKRTVPAPLLTRAMSLPWNEMRISRERDAHLP